MRNQRTLRRARRVAGVAVAALASLGIGMAAAPVGATPTAAATSAAQAGADAQTAVPEAIRVPAGNMRIAEMTARGVQTYQCSSAAWTFLQPDAILQYAGRAQVLHTRGPVWTSVVDGSSVTGSVVASSPVRGAIPQLLLAAVAHRGPGLLAAVTYIQRLDTTGGLAPTGACVEGATASIPYTADYVFWAKA